MSGVKGRSGAYPKTAEHRAKLSAASKGNTHWLGKKLSQSHRDAISRNNGMKDKTGPLHPNWKGDNVGYAALHKWVRQLLGSPSECTHCGTTTAKRYEWANVSHEYKREVSDWIRLCNSCHYGYDRKGLTI